ncbi:outer membrane protein assembly factor BamE [Phenylobacterium sp.]|uniref:outer membrane protein assembly factor BamE n=1 Tax=Phenylobacterium sp. TaxID=1871053 RepID=UPI0025F6DCBB|nr:outer membrane protein assembly factor BamE [Phenylobacterium sp.]MBX3485529.1 outer membrane protein assembly factor BamE [Phenylobacterium sp.]
MSRPAASSGLQAALAAVTLAAAGLSACSPITSYSGFQAIDSDPKDVKVGTDTKSTVRAKLGSPSVQSTFDPNVWFYVNQVKERVAFRRPKVTARNVTAIAFNKESELVETVNVYTLKDGKVIAYNTRETPTRGREMTILEQLLGSVGRGGLLPQDDEGVPGSRPGDRR